MNRKCVLGIAALVMASVASTPARAALTVAAIFGDDMVLQRHAAVPVFGTADGDAVVTVDFNGQSVSATANAYGDWVAVLPPMEAAGPTSLNVTAGNEDITLTGVQVGEVWFCSGQSNMGFRLANANEGAAATADAEAHDIHLFRMTAGNGPESTDWQLSSPATAGEFSAVCYWMGLELSKAFGGVPIGLIQATHDGTAIDHWQHSSGGSGDDYDAMVKAVQPFAVKGILWYQGESNGGDLGYADKLANMIAEWRLDWGQETLPFGIVQLAYRSGWNSARNAQLEVADSIGDAFLVVIRDLPGGALHPPEKKPVGIRAAIGARGLVYGEDITWSGPIRDVENSYVRDGIVVLKWKHPGEYLFTDDGLAPGEFKLAGANGRWKAAAAAIVGDTVEVWSSSVPEPVKVQFSYRGVGNLYNSLYAFTADGFVDRLKASEFEIALNGSSGNQPPVARFTYGTDGLSVSLDASFSFDSDGQLDRFQWDFGDGSTADDVMTVEHTYTAAGDYTVVLTVTDNAGATAQDSQTVTVTSGGGEATHVEVYSLKAYAEGAGRGSKRGTAEVVLWDDLGKPVADALVTLRFSGTFDETVTGATGQDGAAKLSTSKTQKGGVTVNACIVEVRSDLDYLPNATDCDF